MTTKIAVGTGKCRYHPGMPIVVRPSDVTATVVAKDGTKSFVRQRTILCATGHAYQAVDPDEFIDDPFSETEEVAIWESEGFPIEPDQEA
jgi:hypothetical protein